MNQNIVDDFKKFYCDELDKNIINIKNYEGYKKISDNKYGIG